jgi:hypothetical protein
MNQCPHQHAMRSDLPPGIPERMKHLPIDERGYPVPWFVGWIDENTPEFRSMDYKKFIRALKEKLCWVCGNPLGRHLAFVLGPMCTITRTTAEPPSHRECAEWSVKACPFLSKPKIVRREIEEREIQCAGEAILRNPGASAIWMTRLYTPFSDGKGGVLLRVGDADEVTWWREGRSATREEVEESIRTGLPLLYAADDNNPEAVAEINQRYEAIEPLLPK